MSQRHWLQSLQVALPVIQAPMAGAQDEELACAVAAAGGLGSLPCASLSPAGIVEQVTKYRQRTRAPLNLNFFCHLPPPPSLEALTQWRARLEPYYRELQIDDAPPGASRRPFDEELCALVEQLRPEVVSFHFGLPASSLVERVRGTGARLLSTATTVAEARALEAGGVDAIIAQGAEAGRSSRHVPREPRRRRRGRHLRPRAADRRRRTRAGDRRRWRRGCAWRSGGPRPRCERGSGRHGLPPLSPEPHLRAASPCAPASLRRFNAHHQRAHRPARARHRQSHHA